MLCTVTVEQRAPPAAPPAQHQPTTAWRTAPSPTGGMQGSGSIRSGAEVRSCSSSILWWHIDHLFWIWLTATTRSGWRRLLEERLSTSRAAQFTGPFASNEVSERGARKKMAQWVWRPERQWNCPRNWSGCRSSSWSTSVARWDRRYSRQRSKIFVSAFWSAEFIKKISGEVCQPSCCLGMIISCCPSSTTGWSRVIPSITTSYKRRTWPIEAITSRSLRDEHQSKLTNRVQYKVCNPCKIFTCANVVNFPHLKFPSYIELWDRLHPKVSKRRRSLRDEHQSELTNRVQYKVCNGCKIFICAKTSPGIHCCQFPASEVAILHQAMG